MIIKNAILPNRQGNVRAICISCNNPVTRKWGSHKSKFCSNKCQNNYTFEQKYINWINGDANLFKSSRSLKRATVRLKGYFCNECGISTWNEKSISLELEHIDGNSQNSSHNNMCLLCPNCHSQTKTFKGRNKGNGRHARRLRYKEGKSY